MEEQQQRQDGKADELKALEEGRDHAGWERAGMKQRLGGVTVGQFAAYKSERGH
jgi:hypothetical protein